MVDREARDKMAELLRHFVARRITDKELDWNLPHSQTDSTAHHIADVLEMTYERFWGKPQYIGHRKSLSREQRRQLARVVMYLYTDLERPTTTERFLAFLRRKMVSTSRELWPFFSRDEYEEALSHPKLLCGEQQSS